MGHAFYDAWSPDSGIEEQPRLFRTADEKEQARTLSERLHGPMIETDGPFVDYREGSDEELVAAVFACRAGSRDRKPLGWLRVVGVPFECLYIHGIQHCLVGRFKNNGWDGGLREKVRLCGFKRFDPASETETPAIAGVKPGKLQLRTRRHKVIALFVTERQKFPGHYRTKFVSASIGGMSFTAAIAFEASPRITTTGGKFLAKDIAFDHTDRA